MYNVLYEQDSRFVSVQVFSALVPLADWDSTDLFPGGMQIVAIEMTPGAAGDTVVINDRAIATGGRIFTHIALGTYDIAVRNYGGHSKFGFKGVLCRPIISQAANVGNFIITFELA